jgi:hypothetical protein
MRRIRGALADGSFASLQDTVSARWKRRDEVR